jgi:signal transduction histidine kinase
MTALGELASSVAHEIRNPLNTIGTITQQLRIDFVPAENIEEYKTLSELVYKEVKRINDTIENFLIFAKPMPLKPELINTSTFFEQIKKQYEALLIQKKIVLTLNEYWSGNVKWDPQQIRQVLINLIQNSIESIENNGVIELNISQLDSTKIEINLTDSGKGIPVEIVNKIFDLYFTTKQKGNGIGLSVVQKIIYEHNGIISVENKPVKGAVFRIIIPKNI